MLPLLACKKESLTDLSSRLARSPLVALQMLKVIQQTQNKTPSTRDNK